MHPIIFAAFIPFGIGTGLYWTGFIGWKLRWFHDRDAKQLMDHSVFFNIWAGVTAVIGLFAQMLGL